MDRNRIRRRDPARTAPIRSAANVFRQPVPDGPEDWDRDDGEPDVAAQGVREGYRVLWEQIRRGRRVASELGDPDAFRGRRRRYDEDFDEEPPRRRSGAPGFVQEQLRRTTETLREIADELASRRPSPLRLGESTLSFYAESGLDLALLGFELLGSALPGLSREVDRGVERGFDEFMEAAELPEEIAEELAADASDWRPGPSSPTEIQENVSIPIVVWSSRPTRIELIMEPSAQGGLLALQTLRAEYPNTPPLLEVAFVPIVCGPTILRIRVPDRQPAGRYSGKVVDDETGQPVGTLSVEVLEAL